MKERKVEDKLVLLREELQRTRKQMTGDRGTASITNISQQTMKVQKRLPKTTAEIAEHRSLNYFIALCTQKQTGGKDNEEHAVDFAEMQKLKFASLASGQSFDALSRSTKV